jgi:hypothetical protein
MIGAQTHLLFRRKSINTPRALVGLFIGYVHSRNPVIRVKIES